MEIKNGELTASEAIWMCKRFGFVMRHKSWPEGNTISDGEYGGLQGPFDSKLASDHGWAVGPGKVMPDPAEPLTYAEALEKLVRHGGSIVHFNPDGTGTVYPMSAIAAGTTPSEERRAGTWRWRENAGRPTASQPAEVSQEDRDLMEQALREANVQPPEQSN